jgi:LysM repeat protein
MRWPNLLAPILALTVAAGAAQAEPNAVRYTIRRGDTLSAIAKRFGVSVASICRWNAIRKDALLAPGRKIGVPLPPGARARSEQKDSGTPRIKSWRELAKQPERPGFVSFEGAGKKWQGQLVRSDGTLLPEAAQRVSELLAGQSGPRIDPRLIALLSQVSDTFGGRKLRIVSGYRPGQRSRHGHGQAVDFSVEGVPNWALRDYLLGLERVGVGYYPNSIHVHLDVREQSFSWVDLSRPGQRARYLGPKRARR